MPARRFVTAASLALALGLGACGQPPAASAPMAPAAQPAAQPAAAPSVADLVGARGSSGESVLQERGYTSARVRGLTAYWWHPAGACVRVVTNQGRYQSVANVAASDCGR
jgi:hypothetical protein